MLIGLALGQAQAVKIGIYYDFGGKQDRGFNASAAKGLQRIQQVTRIESIEGVADEATKTYKVSELAKNGADLIIGIGFSR